MTGLFDMIAGVGPTLLRVHHDSGDLTFSRGDPGVGFSPEEPLAGKLRAAFFDRDGFALARAWLDHLKAAGPVAPPSSPVSGAGGDDEPEPTSDC